MLASGQSFAGRAVSRYLMHKVMYEYDETMVLELTNASFDG